MNRTKFLYQMGRYTDAVTASLTRLREGRIIPRILDHDHTVWKENPAEIVNRFGWLKSPENMVKEIPRLEDLVRNTRNDGYTHALLLGMGGSSLAPDLLGKVFGVREGYLDLRVLDTTDPAAVRAHAERLDLSRTLFVVSTKSGTTSETLAFFRYFYNRTLEKLGVQDAGNHFIAITDPGSALHTLANDLGFRETFLNDPDIGGRYSALSFFGLVPAALLGIDIGLLLEKAESMARQSRLPDPTEGRNTGAVLGAILGTLQTLGRDKLTLISSPILSPLGAWIEQLLAESTGKEGKGILPVEGELPGSPAVYGTDRLFVSLSLNGDITFEARVLALEKAGHPVVRIELSNPYDIGAEFYRWEMATAVAGYFMGINPFDQPDVESAKIQARRMIEEYRVQGLLPATTPALLESGIEIHSFSPVNSLKIAMEKFLGLGETGGYVALQAYINPTPEAALVLDELRLRIRDRLKVATTVGFGPRFLHSTGQLHKGDRGNGLFIQITSQDKEDLPIPDNPGERGSSITFGVLKAAQAMGDRQALIDAGRKVIRFHINGDVVEGIRDLSTAVADSSVSGG